MRHVLPEEKGGPSMGSIAPKDKANAKVAVDPVCGMKVNPSTTFLVNTYQGKIYHFCSKACLKEFKKDPHKYLNSKPGKPKGWWRRLLQRETRIQEGKPRVALKRERRKSGIIVTHIGYILDYVDADIGHVLMNGELACSGNPREILKTIKKQSYDECVNCCGL